MKQTTELEKLKQQIDTIVDVSSAFEGIASLRITQIKNQVLQSQEFFQDLWQIYNQINVKSTSRFSQQIDEDQMIDKDLLIVITAEGGLSGDIDQKLIDLMLKVYKPEQHDIIAIGRHGVVQLAHQGIKVNRYYKLPVRDMNINVTPIIQEVLRYRSTTAYYQTYVSLMIQDVKRISLKAAVTEKGKQVQEGEEVIDGHNYIFEPSMYDVIAHLEDSMLGIALSQVILESKLAQYASRFRAMSSAHNKATESADELRIRLNRARRNVSDERLKEIINGIQKGRRNR